MAEIVTTFDAVSIGSAKSPGQLMVNSPATLKGNTAPDATVASFRYDGEQGTLSVGAAGQALRGVVKVGPTATRQSVLLDGENAWVQIGSEVQPGQLTIWTPVVREDQYGRTWTELISALDFEGEDGVLTIGDAQLGVPGVLKLGALSGRAVVTLDSRTASMTLGGNALPPGKVNLLNHAGDEVIALDAASGAVTLQSGQTSATLTLKGGSGDTAVKIDAATASITCGASGANGSVFVKDSAGITAITLSANDAEAIIGSQGVDGRLVLRDSQMIDIVTLDAANGNIWCGGNGQDGDIFVRNAVAQTTVSIDGENGNITCGGNGTDGDLILNDSSGNERIHLDGSTGDIKLTGADFAEDFDVQNSPATAIEPGMTMVIGGDGGALEPCTQAYDRRVAGVISGAGAYQPGIIMDKQEGRHGRLPVALSGKVYCLVDASDGPIQCGDLLTTSDRRGHAMKATSPGRAFGSVIGKALGGLEQGQGLIPILVALQ